MTQQAERNVIDLLQAQHSEIKRLFAAVTQASGTEKEGLFRDLVRLLAVHESAEEQVVHPTARRTIEDGDDIVDARLAEESEAKQALADLYDMGVDHPDFDTRLQALADDVIRHATAEETEEFSRMRETMSEYELSRMAGVVEAAEAVAPTRPHPMAGESATANLALGPPTAVFDRVRDAVRDWAKSS